MAELTNNGYGPKAVKVAAAAAAVTAIETTELIANRIQKLEWQLEMLDKNIEEQVNSMRRELEDFIPGLHIFAASGARLDRWQAEWEAKQEELKALRRILEEGGGKNDNPL